MALTGIQIYKLLPQTNCKECGFPTCLAFAMKLAGKQVELSACPYASDEAKEKLADASRPPVRLITVRSKNHEVKAGNEIVLYRHEKTFYNKPGLFSRFFDTDPVDSIMARAKQVDEFRVEYVGIELSYDGFVIQADAGNGKGSGLGAAVAALREVSEWPLILIGDVGDLESGLEKLDEAEKPMLGLATAENWEPMAALAKARSTSLAVKASSIDELVELVEKVNAAGVEDIVLAPDQHGFLGSLTANTLIRRMALKKNFRSFGYPLLCFPGGIQGRGKSSGEMEIALAAQVIGKYGGFIALDHFSPETAYALLVLRENIYTDPQKPIQMQPGLYEINDPSPDDPLLVTTNFSITYFSVANEVEGVGLPAWLLVTDAEGMSVLTAWAAGKFNAERIAKDVKRFEVTDKINHRQIVIPGDVAVISGELEEELPGWEVKVGPREAVDLPSFMKQVL
ncbi:MAG: acetyl-CoA decarbonylase/synthase complex subunit gamma [Anaerolineaceae bacterium]|nr:acetyl-CoA decarbonylase/synthase complex subunit gamma [Anaerolineaceae bacterium]